MQTTSGNGPMGFDLRRLWGLILLGFGFALAQGALAQEQGVQEQGSAHALAEEVKNDLLRVIRHKDELAQQSGEEEYFDAVEGVLAPVVDFDYIARGVMGNYAKQATDAQRERFAKVFKRGLITTYAKGLAGYGNHDISVLPPEGDISGKRSTSVLLEVREGDSVNRLAFTMIKRDSGWKIANMILDGVNLGKTFRNQFAQAMQKNGDIDTVIDNWSV